MVSLEVTFGGLRLRNPVIIASAPPTETVENIARCAEAGAGAVVTKTFADFDAKQFPLGARRAYVDRSGMWALSTFRRETLTLDQGVHLVEDSVRLVDIPVIASVGALTMDPTAWLVSCRAAENAGASMVQLDLFYSPHPRSSPENIRLLLELLEALSADLSIPIAPKLNMDLPAHYMAELLKQAPLAAAFAIDSLRTPVPLDPRRNGHALTRFAPNASETSLFGPWQKPVTLQYLRTLAENSGLDVCAGGGLMNGYDAVEALLLGASCVQVATTVIRHGFKRISQMLDQLSAYMMDNHHESISDFRAAALRSFAIDEHDLAFIDTKAVVDHERCTMCGLCSTLVFCPEIEIHKDRINILDHCDGCGLCVAVCPTRPKALRFAPTGTDRVPTT